MISLRKKSLVITVPNPCHEDWGKMTPTEQGRFCAACQKHLVDFTVLSDDEITKLLAKQNESICGRYSVSQLNRAITPASGMRVLQVPDMVRKMAASVLLFFGIYNQAFSQQKVKPVAYVNATSNKPTSVAQKGKVVITGQLLLADTLRPLRNHGFVIEGTALKSVTDNNGNFKFVVNENWQGKTITIITSAATKLVLDKREVIVPPMHLVVDTAYYDTAITLYRYPVKEFFETAAETLDPIVINKPYEVKRLPMMICGGSIVKTTSYVNMNGDLMDTEKLPDLAIIFKKMFNSKKDK